MWQTIETAPKGRKIIVFGEVPGYGHRMMTFARYWPKHTLQVAEGYEDEPWAETDEHGQAFMPADWYEEIFSEEVPATNLKPTHWMPLPTPPDDEQ